jgi:hypothetical protein
LGEIVFRGGGSWLDGRGRRRWNRRRLRIAKLASFLGSFDICATTFMLRQRGELFCRSIARKCRVRRGMQVEGLEGTRGRVRQSGPKRARLKGLTLKNRDNRRSFDSSLYLPGAYRLHIFRGSPRSRLSMKPERDKRWVRSFTGRVRPGYSSWSGMMSSTSTLAGCPSCEAGLNCHF